jgi:uncharacterized protein YbjT (DUF2867 family)
MTYTILAFGASGKFAGHVVPALKEHGARVRGFVREEKEGNQIRDRGADEVAMGDLTDRQSVERALEGVDRVFYIAPAFMPHEGEVGRGVVEACVAAGVERFVFSSVIHPVLSGLSNHAAKQPVAEALLDSGMTYALLHPALYFQNYRQSWRKVVESGVLAEPWSCDTRFSRVDFRDVAEVAAIALTEDRLNYGTFELCSDGWLDRHQVTALIGKALGRVIRAQRIDPDTLGDETKPMRPMFHHYEHVGLRGNPLTLRAILGRAPRTLEQFFSELAGEGRKG